MTANEYPFPLIPLLGEDQVQEQQLEPNSPTPMPPAYEYSQFVEEDNTDELLLPNYEDCIAPSSTQQRPSESISDYNISSGWGKCYADLIDAKKELSGYEAIVKRKYLTHMKDANFLGHWVPTIGEFNKSAQPPPLHLDPSKTLLLRRRKTLRDSNMDAPASSTGGKSHYLPSGSKEGVLPMTKRRKTNDFNGAPSASLVASQLSEKEPVAVDQLLFIGSSPAPAVESSNDFLERISNFQVGAPNETMPSTFQPPQAARRHPPRVSSSNASHEQSVSQSQAPTRPSPSQSRAPARPPPSHRQGHYSNHFRAIQAAQSGAPTQPSYPNPQFQNAQWQPQQAAQSGAPTQPSYPNPQFQNFQWQPQQAFYNLPPQFTPADPRTLAYPEAPTRRPPPIPEGPYYVNQVFAQYPAPIIPGPYYQPPMPTLVEFMEEAEARQSQYPLFPTYSAPTPPSNGPPPPPTGQQFQVPPPSSTVPGPQNPPPSSTGPGPQRYPYQFISNKVNKPVDAKERDKQYAMYKDKFPGGGKPGFF